jgi:hypothetical protein
MIKCSMYLFDEVVNQKRSGRKKELRFYEWLLVKGMRETARC